LCNGEELARAGITAASNPSSATITSKRFISISH
jgi:hypothetical protein